MYVCVCVCVCVCLCVCVWLPGRNSFCEERRFSSKISVDCFRQPADFLSFCLMRNCHDKFSVSWVFLRFVDFFAQAFKKKNLTDFCTYSLTD